MSMTHINNLLDNAAFRYGLVTVSTGTSGSGGPSIDTAGYSGALFIAVVTATATSTGKMTLYAQGSASTASTAFTTYSGSSAAVGTSTAAMAHVAVVDVARPLKRYIRPYVVQTGTGIATDVACMLYGAKDAAVTQHANVANSVTVVSPTT